MSEILKEMYMNPDTREKVQEINSKKLCYALKNYAIANTKSQIKIPKAYKNISLYKFHNIFSDKYDFVVTIIH